ncbi:MAG: type II secretion system protein [Candidatus Baltobacteraceae bacterium]|jgi:prepilin-type N-terminal cleavage/methylation domain-containing protein
MTDVPSAAAPSGLRAQRGFTLLEALIAIAVTSAAVLGVAGAVLGMLRSLALETDKAALADDALNVLTDLRAATAYDGAFLAKLAGRSTSQKLTLAGPAGSRSLVVTATVTPQGNGVYVAAVTAATLDGVAVTEQAVLTQEAPAPGSVVDDTPSASPAP